MPHILIVDDDSATRRMLRRTLERAGHTVSESEDGNSALRALQSAAADVVITDVIMPGMEGIETIQTLRKRYPTVKIIAMSGGGHIGPDDYLSVAEAFGAARIFKKPFDTDDLLAAIEEVLGRAQKS